MPHQCTNCGRGFEDGSQEMLSGCPNCGGNKFQFRPEGGDSSPPAEDPPEPPEPPGGNSTVAKTVGKTAATVRDLVGGSDGEPGVGARAADSADAPTGTDGQIEAGPAGTENSAQASARGEVVSPDELPDHTGEGDREVEPAGADSAASVEPPTDDTQDRPDLKELREELNSQFESVKVVAPGQYELNLMELYDREEYIVALQEDGHYSIQVPETIRE
ncbi:OapC/ArvC family zinc-ribbon domain-containing protein [Haloarcula sediminis]|uniref:OapC/ArvC family zinc-ribbon domain-containing protein n=1 Tax=Haloarcula sediminis TaxID=3111777 RepID=UPI002D7890B3|nr:Zn-ribbon containing protein [Haloarcula sp. CK38]